MHSPPTDAKWKRFERALSLLREGVRGDAGPARIHAGTPSRSLRDPEATENIDIAGAIAFATSRPEGKITRAAARRQLAICVYLFRNWPAFADQHHVAMRIWAHAAMRGIVHTAESSAWMRRASKAPQQVDRVMFKIADAAIEEFTSPAHCVACCGYGLEVTGVRVGQSCGKCGGAGTVEWSANARARGARVRRRDWEPIWSKPYLALLDHLVELERKGAALHAAALSEDDG